MLATSLGQPLDPWWAKPIVVAAAVAMVAIRAPHGRRSRSVAVNEKRKGVIETALLILVMAGFFVPFIWAFSSALSFADFPLYSYAWALGTICLVAGLWLFHRSHADLGTNWSITLELREGHTLVTGGVYRRVRHPMYSSLLLYSIGQAIVLPNWIAGPSYLVPFVALLATRLGPEERMMRDRFGRQYDDYAARTKRLIPWVF